ncbi:hypothetical protein [Methylosinus sp. RM1]|uniref:hypothetical protein n=1 Tax=Methylosinus sp. RM1 TaxID=2583817 RepID=UPI00140E84B3|nr:hypothetical protein [Methylosinus sp. RM1]
MMKANAPKAEADIDVLFRDWTAADEKGRKEIEEWALDGLNGRQHRDFEAKLSAWREQNSNTVEASAPTRAASPRELAKEARAASSPIAAPTASAVVPAAAPSSVRREIVEPAAPVLISRSTPANTAQTFAQRHTIEGVSKLRRHNQSFWYWENGAYLRMSEETVTKLVSDFLLGAGERNSEGGWTSFNPKTRDVNEVMRALESATYLNDGFAAPCWLPSGEQAGEWLVFRNAIVNVRTLETRPHTHLLWAHDVLAFDWKPTAECPIWLKTLESIFPGEKDAQDLLEAWIGYCMTLDTWAHKGMLHLGVTRSGKSTVQRLMEKLVGPRGWVSLALDKWLASEFSAHGLIGKRCAFFPDVRLKEGKMYGHNYDPGGMEHKSAQMLLKITGEDSVSLRKMHGMELIFEGKLPAKINMISNVVPNFNDDILPNRFLKLHYRIDQEKAGNMDPFLGQKLEAELSGIAARCLAAYSEVRRCGWFKAAECGLALDRQLVRARHPHLAMIAECLEPTDDLAEHVVKKDAARACKAWLVENGHKTLAVMLRDEDMGNHIIPRFDHFQGLPPRNCWRQSTDGKRRWVGLRLTAEGRRLAGIEE